MRPPAGTKTKTPPASREKEGLSDLLPSTTGRFETRAATVELVNHRVPIEQMKSRLRNVTGMQNVLTSLMATLSSVSVSVPEQNASIRMMAKYYENKENTEVYSAK